MTTLTYTTPRPASAMGRAVRQLGIDSAYLLLGLPLAIVRFVVLLTGFALSIGLLITLAGLPVLAGTLYVARGFATLERLRIAPVLGRPARLGAYRTGPPPGVRGWRRVFTPMRQGQHWLDLLHAIAVFPIATATWSIALTWWVAAVTGPTYWAYDWALPRSPDSTDLAQLIGLGDSDAARVGLHTVIGLFFLATLPLVVRACALVQANVGQALLNTIGDVRARIAGLENDSRAAREQTAAAVSAEAGALRRLERDIHDGPQQRLVRLAMDLGRAQRQLDSDPRAASASVTEALQQTREALDELRALSRGISPPVLADRGLAAALAALAGRATVPVDVDIDAFDEGEHRPAPAVENAAYFLVAEALTNVAKHSYASQCQITLARRDGFLTVSVTDDGVGGAQVAKGYGLAGLADRVRGAGGQFTVDSPAGGPTTLSAVLPCG